MKTLVIAAAAIATALAATPAAAQAVSANPRATASARLLKPPTLSALQNLNFRTIVMGTLTGSSSVSMASDGVLTCGANLTCAASGQPGQFRITGTQGQVVLVSSSAASFPLAGSNGGTLAFVPSLPTPITLGNSGAPGNSFNIGGSIAIAVTQQDGVYSGQIDVQVAYQ